MTALLELHDVHVAYGGVVAVRGISCHVDPGTVVALIGSNGAGKTSTIRAIMGLEPLAAGRIRFRSADLGNVGPHRRHGLGLACVPEGRRVIAPFTIEENLRFGARGTSKAVFAERLARVHDFFPTLANRSAQMAGSLSGGEQQMLAIGRALMADPALLLLDEPSMGLAPLVVRGVFQALGRLRQEGMTMLLVEQNVQEAFALADHVYVVERGVVVEEGPAVVLRDDARIIDAYLGVETGGSAGRPRRRPET